MISQFDFEAKQNLEMDDTDTVGETSNIVPQPKSMEMEMHSKIEWLCNKKLLVSDFERNVRWFGWRSSKHCLRICRLGKFWPHLLFQ